MTDFTGSYVLTDTVLEAAIGADPRTAAIALKAAAAATQAWYCQRATQNIDRLPFQGWKKLSSQALQFPRKFQLDPEQDNPWGESVSLDSYGYYAQSAVPAEVISACVEEAIALYEHYSDSERTSRQALQADGVKSFSLGGGYSESFGSISTKGDMKSRDAYLLLEGWIELAPNTV